MGNPFPNETPEIRLPAEVSDGERNYVMPPSPRPVPVTRHVVLFVLTFITTTLFGADLYAGFLSGLDQHAVANLPSVPWLILGGLWFSGGVLAILGIHEFGHYFACKYYRVDASLPYFLPLPLLMPGTLGAVIRIRQPIASKLQFFDIGIAGPIAGFVVAVPILLLGMSLSNVVTLPQDFDGTNFNDPLLFQFVARMFFPSIPAGQTINLHPAGWAAWWGLLATALNLCPVGQLDGGHVSYAVFGRKSSVITLGVAACLIGLTLYSVVVLHTPSYLVWTALLIIMLSVMGPHHPRTLDEHRPLDATRLWLAAFAAVMLIVSFTPIPIAALTTGR